MPLEIPELIEYFLGTASSVESYLERYDIQKSVEDVEQELAEANLERCPLCDWWCEAGELVDEFGEVVGCENCR